MRAVIAGATGLVGSVLIQKLLTDPRVELVTSVSRRSLGLDHPKLREVLVHDLAQLPRVASALAGTHYFCTLGTTIKDAGSPENFRRVDFDAIVKFGRIAKSHSAHSFVLVSASGANSESWFFYPRVKGETERALMDLQLKRLVIFRPGLLMGERKSKRFAEEIAISAGHFLAPLLPEGIKKRAMTPVDQLAKRMIIESSQPEAGVFTIEAGEI